MKLPYDPLSEDIIRTIEKVNEQIATSIEARQFGSRDIQYLISQAEKKFHRWLKEKKDILEAGN